MFIKTKNKAELISLLSQSEIHKRNEPLISDLLWKFSPINTKNVTNKFRGFS